MRRYLSFALTVLFSSAVSASQDSTGAYLEQAGKPSKPLSEKRQAIWSQDIVAARTAEKNTQNAPASSAQGAGVEHQAIKPNEKEKRAENPAKSARSHYFSFWETSHSLLRDEDADGYHSRFKIRFDADVSIGNAKVYAKMYIRRVGDSGAWYRYFTTDDFWIYGTSGTDDYYVDTNLTEGYPTGYYDVLIDLYEVGYSDIVATIGPFESSALRDLALEERALDRPLANLGFHIDSARTELLQDTDGDGFYSKFRISIDPDLMSGSAEAYAIVSTRANNGSWQEELRSNTFTIFANSTADQYSFTAEWQSGYPTDYYDFRIEIVDVLSGLIVTSISSENPALSRVPLEDLSRDVRPTPPPPSNGGNDRDSDSREGGGGSVGWLSVLLGMAVVIRRLRTAKAH